MRLIKFRSSSFSQELVPMQRTGRWAAIVIADPFRIEARVKLRNGILNSQAAGRVRSVPIEA